MQTHRELFTEYLKDTNGWGPARDRALFRDWTADHDMYQCECCGRWGHLGDEVTYGLKSADAVYDVPEQPWAEETLLCEDCTVDAWCWTTVEDSTPDDRSPFYCRAPKDRVKEFMAETVRRCGFPLRQIVSYGYTDVDGKSVTLVWEGKRKLTQKELKKEIAR